MKCLKCGSEFKPRHKYHEFCSKLCRVRNYFGDKKETKKPFVPKKKIEKEFFDWDEPMY